MLDSKLKAELWFTLQVALEITVMGGRGATVRLSGGWRKMHKIKETSRDSYVYDVYDEKTIKRVWL